MAVVGLVVGVVIVLCIAVEPLWERFTMPERVSWLGALKSPPPPGREAVPETRSEDPGDDGGVQVADR